jgi:hypothetical protein
MSTIIIVDMRLRQLGLGRFFPHIQDRYGILNLKFIDPKQNAGFADSKRNYWQRWRQQKHVVCSTTLSKGCPQLPGCRQTAPYSPEFEPDIVLQRTNAIQAASYSLMCDTKKMRDSVHYT